VAWAFQESVLDILATQVSLALHEFRPRAVMFCGGVAANNRLRQGLADLCEKEGISFQVPAPQWCTDNAAMIGAAGILKLRSGFKDGLDLGAQPQASSDPESMLRDFFPGRSF